MSLTAADLDGIRRLAQNKQLPWGEIDGWEVIAMDLLAEVDRLRSALNAIRNGCDTMLNPTEGEN